LAALAPRYAPERPFPPYAFTPGRSPHPRSDPDGHSYAAADVEAPPLDASRWRESETYLYGIDLFNHGYYWEAHEQWEALWLAAGRHGKTAEFLKGLIKLTASALKVRLGQKEGVRHHALSAIAQMDAVAAAVGERRYAGLDVDRVQALARTLLAMADRLPDDASQRVLDGLLVLEEGDGTGGGRAHPRVGG
jgi:predicted metal-dependent hydrolase